MKTQIHFSLNKLDIWKSCIYVVKMENLEVILHLIKESLFYKIRHKLALNGELLVDINSTKKRFKMSVCQEHMICTKLSISVS